MKQQWQQLALKIDALSLRERAMLFGAAVAVLVGAYTTFVFGPQSAEEVRLTTQLVQDRNLTATLQAQLERVAGEGRGGQEGRMDPDAAAKTRLENLRAELARAEESVRGLQKELVAPDKMASVLQGILNQQGKLRLVSLKTLPVTSVSSELSGNAAAKDGTSLQRGQPGQAVQPVLPGVHPRVSGEEKELLYRHGVEIVVQGGYLDLMQYLVQLEKLPWRLIWGKADLRVVAHPDANLTLEVYTLSLEKKWLNI